ncbi:MAG TPA: sigma-70 family RNA polymerase sigma factor [Gemmataceae bacterium]|jgi:RNA polymerase sigma factor (sigma-70 family)
MANGQLGTVLRQIRRLAGASPGDESTDGPLLRRFADHRDEAAFDALLRRHGPLVLGVCRRVLGDAHDAEDAFQAAFLVLARRAAALDRRGSVAGFLYTVAYHIALRARADAARRRERERRAAKMPAIQATDDLLWRDLRPVLDEELNRLPEKYRAPILLCYLEGKTQEEAAALLGWTKGTVSGRLARARDILRGRLARRGLALSAAALSAGLAEEASAALSASLRKATLDAALCFAAGQTPTGVVADLAQAALRGTGLLKGKAIVALLLAATVLAAGTGALVSQMNDSASAPSSKGEESKSEPKRVDVQGDPLPPGAVVRLGSVRLCQGGPVRSAAFSPDGKLLASSGHYGHNPEVIRLWDTATGKEVHQFPGVAGYLAFSPDGKCLAASREFGELCLWNASTGKQLWCWDVKAEPRAPNDPDPKFYGIAFSPDGKTLAVAIGDKTIRLIERATGKERLRLKEETFSMDVAFSADGKTVRTGEWSFDLATGKKTRREKAPAAGKPAQHLGGSRAIALSPDGRLWAEPVFGSLRVWDVATQIEVVKLDRHYGSIQYAVPSADRKIIRTVGGPFDETIREWDAATGKHLRKIRTAPWQKFLALSADGRVSAMPRWDDKLVLVDLASGEIIQECGEARSRIGAMALSADGKRLAALSGDKEKVLHLWDMVAGKELRPLRGKVDGFSRLAFSPNGKTLAAAASLDNVRLWETATGEPLKGPAWKPKRRANPFEESILPAPVPQDFGIALDPKAKPSPAASLAFSPSGKTLAVMSGFHRERWAMFDPPDAGLLRLYDVTTGKELFQLCRQEPIVAFSPDGKRMATGGHHDYAVYLWDAGNGKQLARLAGHRGVITSLAFSADGRTLISGSADGTALVWDVKARTP